MTIDSGLAGTTILVTLPPDADADHDADGG